MAGSIAAPAPLILGHEFSGRVIESDADGLEPGRRVTVMPLLPCGACAPCRQGRAHLCRERIDIGLTVDGGFAEIVRIPRARLDATVFTLPDGITTAGGALIEPLAVGLRVAGYAAPAPGRTALVLGVGMIGQAVVTFLALSGASRIIAVDPSQTRRSQAQVRGAHEVCAPEDLRELLAGASVDATIDCAGHPDAVSAALRHARPAGTVVLAAVYGHRIPVSLDRVVGQELVVRGSFAYQSEFTRVIELLATGAVDADSFVTESFDLEHALEAFDRQRAVDHTTKVVVCPRGIVPRPT